MYGYCDAHYRAGMSKEECIEFVKNGKFLSLSLNYELLGIILYCFYNTHTRSKCCPWPCLVTEALGE